MRTAALSAAFAVLFAAPSPAEAPTDPLADFIYETLAPASGRVEGDSALETLGACAAEGSEFFFSVIREGVGLSCADGRGEPNGPWLSAQWLAGFNRSRGTDYRIEEAAPGAFELRRGPLGAAVTVAGPRTGAEAARASVAAAYRRLLGL